MIPEQFPTIDPLTSFGLSEDILRGYHRHRMFGVLAATSTRLRTIFHDRSRKTRVLAGTKIPTFARLLVQRETPRISGLHLEYVLFLSPVPLNSTRLL